MNSRGQQSAPFELMIAIILMGFVLLIGFNAISDLEEKRCIQENNFAINEFKNAIQQSLSGPTSVSLNFRKCDSRQEQELVLRVETSANFCEARCFGVQGACMLLDLTNPSLSKCVNISPLTNFQSNDCVAQPGFLLVDLKTDPIISGKYLLNISSASSTSSSPIICVQRQCRGPECDA